MNIVLATLNAKYIHSALALRYLRAFCQDEFPAIQLVEFTIHDLASDILADLYERQPDVIAFSVYIWNVEQSVKVVQMIRKVMPDVTIVVGGPEVSYDVVEWMERVPEIDIIVVGEGEATFRDVLTRLQNEESVADVAGIAWRAGQTITLNRLRAKMNLNTIPSPFRDPKDLYSLRNRVVYFEASRGCPFTCQFCLSSIEMSVRYFDLDRVKEDLLHLIQAGIKTVKFVDRTFNLSRHYALELFRFLIDHREDTVFQFEITADILPTDIVDFLAQHAPPGAFRFEIGVQSTNDLTNSLVKRRQDFQRLAQTVTRVKESGKIVQHLDLIAGLPKEDYRSFSKTFDEVFALEPEELQLGFLKMLRGTGLRSQASEYGYVYLETAPYEVLANDALSYGDLLRIKQVEDVLEKYWNDGRLKRTIQFLCRDVFSSPFEFFQSFGAFWHQQNWNRIGHQLADLFTRLQAFLRSQTTHDQERSAESLMILEFLLAHRVRPNSQWWDERIPKSERHHIVNALATDPLRMGGGFPRLNLSREEVEKRVALAYVPYDPAQLMVTSSYQATPTLLAVYYPPTLERHQIAPSFSAPVARVLS